MVLKLIASANIALGHIYNERDGYPRKMNRFLLVMVTGPKALVRHHHRYISVTSIKKAELNTAPLRGNDLKVIKLLY